VEFPKLGFWEKSIGLCEGNWRPWGDTQPPNRKKVLAGGGEKDRNQRDLLQNQVSDRDKGGSGTTTWTECSKKACEIESRGSAGHGTGQGRSGSWTKRQIPRTGQKAGPVTPEKNRAQQQGRRGKSHGLVKKNAIRQSVEMTKKSGR